MTGQEMEEAEANAADLDVFYRSSKMLRRVKVLPWPTHVRHTMCVATNR